MADDHVVVDAGELRTLARAARQTRSELEAVRARAGGIMATLDRRGWNAGAADAAWNAARGGIATLGDGLDARASDLEWRAQLLDMYESGSFSGSVPFGVPLSDPVNSFSGNLVHTEVDLQLPTRGRLPLLLSRTYNSRDPRVGLFGPGWSSSLEWAILPSPDGRVVVRRADGKRDRFMLGPDGTYVGDLGVHDRLTELPGRAWKLVLRSTRHTMHFSLVGELEQIEDRNGNFLTVDCDADGRIATVRDECGQRIDLDYGDGYLTKVTDSAGREVRYAYDGDGRLQAVVDPTGARTSYVYDGDSRLQTITNALGHVVLTNRFDPLGRVVEQLDAVGGKTTLTYDDDQRMTLLRDARGNTLTVFHNRRGQVSRVVDAVGGEVTYTYTECGNRASIRDRAGATWRFEYDGECQVSSAIDPLGNVERYGYAPGGELVWRRNALGHTWSYAYDSRGNLVSETDPEGATRIAELNDHGQVTRITDADGVSTVYEYDASGNVISIITPVGETRFAYDVAGNRIRRTDANGHVRTASYDALGRLLEVTDPLGSISRVDRDAIGNATRITYADGATTGVEYDANRRPLRLTDALGQHLAFEYDANGNHISITDPAGYVTRMAYDALDRLVEVVDPRGGTWRRAYDAEGRPLRLTDAAGNSLRYERDPLGRLTTFADRLGSRAQFSYDVVGNLVSVIDALGATTVYEYDKAGRRIAQVDALGGRGEQEFTPAGRLAAVVDALGRHMTFTYDAAGRLIGATDPSGAEIKFVLDPVGNLLTKTDRAGATTRFQYDSLDRPIERVDALGNSTRYVFDAVNNLVALSDALGNTTRFQYDSIGRLTAVLDALGHTTRYGYDPRNRLVEHVDAIGDIRRYTYDANASLVAFTHPLGLTTRLELDALGNPLKRIDADGAILGMTYDAEGRPLSAQGSDGFRVGFGYDPLGRRTSLQDELGTTTFAYDPLGRLQSTLDQFGQSVRYRYDAVGNQVALIYPDGHTAEYAYDAHDRLIRVRDWLGGEHTYAYDARGRATVGRVANGSGWRASRDPLGRVRELRHLDPHGDTLIDFTYAYDALGNLTQENESRYSYDAVSRLVSTSGLNGEARFTYDAVGNRTSDDAQLDCDYDARGNLIKDRSASFVWDLGGRLRVVQPNDGGTVEYRYDGLGNLVAERDSIGNERRVTLDYAAPLTRVLSLAGGANCLYGLDRLALIGPERTYYSVPDVRGSVRVVTEQTGVAVARQAYDAWGLPLSKAETTTPFGFTGERQDPSDARVFLRSRWYQPRTGRFMTRDPLPGRLVAPQTQHAYAYAQSNPTTFVDPSGLSAAMAAYLVDLPMPSNPRWLPPWTVNMVPAFPADPLSGADAYLGFLAQARVEKIDSLYGQARALWAVATQYYNRAAGFFSNALTPSDSWIWRLPGLRDVRSWWFTSRGQSAFDLAEGFRFKGNQIEAIAQGMEEFTPWIRPAAKALPWVGALIDAGFSGSSQWQQDTAHNVPLDQKITDTVTTATLTSGASFGAGAAAGLACAATGVGVLISAACAAAGGWVGGKAAAYVAPYADKVVNDVRREVTPVVQWAGHEVDQGYDWAKKHLCFWC